ncbi:MAG: acyltransferase [Calothrix sp. C42_A2020_038]|nr:acyltransferase [Calothrix sp. C42_A2020_038]
MDKVIEKSSSNRLLLHYLDGLRGITALYVVLVHVEADTGQQLSSFWSMFTRAFKYGGFAVGIFVALSGYVLMLPVSRSEKGYLPGTLNDFFKRRSRRILPPYYAAIIFCILIALVVYLLEQFTTFQWDRFAGKGHFYPHFSFIDLLSHLLLVHNLSPATYRSINPPMWSVATEWQIYFIFPLVLLPIWRRFGLLASVFTAFLVGLSSVYFLNGLFDSTSLWYIGIFSLGMVAAEIGFSKKVKLVELRKSLPWGLLCIIFIIIAFITEWRKLGLHIWVGNSFFGVAIACLFIYCTNSIIDEKKAPLILKIFEHPFAITIGTFSYSLYLTHGPILTLLRYWLFNMELPANVFLGSSYLLGTIASIIFAYVFYLLFERPFMSKFQKKSEVKAQESVS